MRGKKADTEFISQYIINCTASGKSSPQEIYVQAEQEIQKIDEQIKNIESLKKHRSKLIDVVNLFKDKKDNSEDINIVNFYKITNINLAYRICSHVLNKEQSLDAPENKAEKLQTLKKLVDLSILKKSNGLIEQGPLFNNFYFYVKNKYT